MEHVANYHQLLSMAKKLRTEKEKQRQLQQLKDEQKNLSVQLEGRRQRLQQQLLQVRQLAIGIQFVGNWRLCFEIWFPIRLTGEGQYQRRQCGAACGRRHPRPPLHAPREAAQRNAAEERSHRSHRQAAPIGQSHSVRTAAGPSQSLYQSALSGTLIY